MLRRVGSNARVALHGDILLPLDILVNVLDVAHHEGLVIRGSPLHCIHSRLAVLLKIVRLLWLMLIGLWIRHSLVEAGGHPTLAANYETCILHDLHALRLSLPKILVVQIQIDIELLVLNVGVYHAATTTADHLLLTTIVLKHGLGGKADLSTFG